MKQSGAPAATARGSARSEPAVEFVQAEPLDRRRLQAYLALMAGDIVAIFAAFCLAGYLYLAITGLAQAAQLAQLLLPVFLTRLRPCRTSLNTHWFLSLDDAKSKIEAWRRDYNECRPHTSLGWMTPAEFASSAGVSPGR